MWLKVVSVAAFISLAGPAWAADRVALLIANSKYGSQAQLRNPPNDARLLGDALRRAGFKVMDVPPELGRQAMLDALAEFSKEAKHADAAFVYFSGHGMEVDGVNYLLPIDASLTTRSEAPGQTVDLSSMIESAAGARLRFVVIDACRDNPFLGSARGADGSTGKKGLARVGEVSHALVAFAAQPGTTASDGEGNNSPYAAALAKWLNEPGVEASRAFRGAHDDVLATTRDEQEPVFSDARPQDEFFFVSPPENHVLEKVDISAKPGFIDLEKWGISEDDLASTAATEILKMARVYDRLPALAAAANKGDAAAAVLLAMSEQIKDTMEGRMFGRDLGKPDWKRATKYARQAVRAGIGRGENILGLMYLSGSGVPKSEEDGLRLLRNAAGRGNALANFNLYNHFNGDVSTTSTSVVYLQRAAKALLPRAMTWLGLIYMDGDTLPQDQKRGLKLLSDAAQSGDTFGLEFLGNAYLWGKGVNVDSKRAIEFYTRGLEAGEWGSASKLASMYYYGHGVAVDRAKAVSIYRRGSDAGDLFSQYDLAILYELGQGVPKDLKIAVALYRKAAVAIEPAMYDMGRCYEMGIGVAQDYAAAVSWYQKAIDEKYAKGYFGLAGLYYEGQGVPKNLERAAGLYHQGAEAGDKPSMDMYGQMLNTGTGVPKDTVEGAKWIAKSQESASQ